MAADLTNAAEHDLDNIDRNEDDVDHLDNPRVELKRSNWAKQSREMKEVAEVPLRFPRVPNETALDAIGGKSVTTDNTDPDSEQAAQNDSDAEEGDTLGELESCEHRSAKCKFFLSLSMSLCSESFDDVDGVYDDGSMSSLNDVEIDGVCEEGDAECLKATQFIQSVPAETRQKVAKYFSTGNPEHLTITKDNLHHIFHLSKMLNLLQLYNECMKFCINENTDEVVALFDNCECGKDVARESKTGYKRFISIVAGNDDDTAVEFYVIVSTIASETKPRNIIKVIDMKRNKEIFQKDVHRLIQLGSGSDCCCVYKNDSPYIFACGGEGKLAQSCYKYDVLLGKWSKCVKLPNPRLNHKVVSPGNGAIYIIGGDTASIDQYTISMNKWTSPASLINQVQSPVCSVYNDRIYIFGGKTLAGPVARVQCYDTITNKVACLPDLPCEFANGKAIAFEHNIYIATEKGHMICFVPETGESYLCSQQPVQRRNFGMFLKNERIYLVGGVALRESVGSPRSTPMYRYNPKKDTWTAETGLCESFPVFLSCVVRYPKYCPVVPFDDNS